MTAPSGAGRTPACTQAAALGVRLDGQSDEDYPDFCFEDYHVPRRGADRLRPVALLVESFAVADVLEAACGLVAQLGTTFGDLRTVWAIKHCGGMTSWELYLYNPPRCRPVVPDDLAAAADAASVPIRPPAAVARRHLDAFSVDLSPDAFAGARSVRGIHVYVPNSASPRRGGISYLATESGMTLENHYSVFAPDEYEGKLRVVLDEAVHLGAARHLVDPLVARLSSASLIHVARKPSSDGLYFSPIDAEQLEHFLAATGADEILAGRLATLLPALDDLRFDVGVDVTTGPDGARASKSALYLGA